MSEINVPPHLREGKPVKGHKKKKPQSGPRRAVDTDTAVAAAAASDAAAEFDEAASERLAAYQQELSQRMTAVASDVSAVVENAVKHDDRNWHYAVEDILEYNEIPEDESAEEGYIEGLVESRFEEECDKAVEWTEWVMNAAIELSNPKWSQATILRAVNLEADQFQHDSGFEPPSWDYVDIDNEELAAQAERLVQRHNLGGGKTTIRRSDILSALQQTDMPDPADDVIVLDGAA